MNRGNAFSKRLPWSWVNSFLRPSHSHRLHHHHPRRAAVARRPWGGESEAIVRSRRRVEGVNEENERHEPPVRGGPSPSPYDRSCHSATLRSFTLLRWGDEPCEWEERSDSERRWWERCHLMAASRLILFPPFISFPSPPSPTEGVYDHDENRRLDRGVRSGDESSGIWKGLEHDGWFGRKVSPVVTDNSLHTKYILDWKVHSLVLPCPFSFPNTINKWKRNEKRLWRDDKMVIHCHFMLFILSSCPSVL